MAGEYRLRKKLGEGGFGTVYEAEHPLLKRRAAVKVLHRAARMDSEGVQRFISEARAANQIRSRHIVDIFSFGRLSDGRHFYVMDLLDGEPLDRYLDRETRFEVPAALQLLGPIAQALDAAHAVGIVHRDLKPQNIFLVWEPSGETVPKLLDFGMAKLLSESPVHTASGTLIGTPLYMSPEQALGRKVDGRADVYSLGLVCHELLTGERPFKGTTAVEVLAGHLTLQPPRMSEVYSGLPSVLDEVVLRMLAKDPNARPATPGEAVAELRRAAERAGYVVNSDDMLRLPRPPRPPAGPPGEDEEAPLGELSTVSEDGAEREAVVRTAEPVRKAGLSWPLMGLLVALGGGATYFLTRAPTDSAQARSYAASTALIAAPLPTVIEASSAVASTDMGPHAVPPSIDLTVQGAPQGARILLHGKTIGEAPGPVALPFGLDALQLIITAPGHEPFNLSLVPNQSLLTTVAMRKRAGPATSRPGISSDLENPF